MIFVSCAILKPEMKEGFIVEKEFTLEELRNYDGQEGRPAYIAIDDVVYDVTNSKKWPKGIHHNMKAGHDLTTAIKEMSPHGAGVVAHLPVVGKLAK